MVLAMLPKHGCGCVPFWAHLALAGSMPFKLGCALLIRSSLLARGSRSRGMGEEERGLELVWGDLQFEGSAGIGEKRTWFRIGSDLQQSHMLLHTCFHTSRQSHVAGL